MGIKSSSAHEPSRWNDLVEMFLEASCFGFSLYEVFASQNLVAVKILLNLELKIRSPVGGDLKRI